MQNTRQYQNGASGVPVLYSVLWIKSKLGVLMYIYMCECKHGHAFKLKFHLSTFHMRFYCFGFLGFFFLCFLFILSCHGTLYTFRPFKVHVSRSRCQFNGLFNACCAMSASRFPETGFGQRVQADIWRIDGWGERWRRTRRGGFKIFQYWWFLRFLHHLPNISSPGGFLAQSVLNNLSRDF